MFYSEDEQVSYWVEWFLSCKGNEYFCEVDEDFMLDRFNLTGLNAMVPHYNLALDLITDNFDAVLEDEMKGVINEAGTKLYGLIHARFIITSRGLSKMAEKFRQGEFGRCPRVYCKGAHVLPIGQSDVLGDGKVRLYCARCEDVYSPKSTRHANMDGAFFGTTFAPFFFLSLPSQIPRKNPADQYVPKIFGFKVHSSAIVNRMQFGLMPPEFQTSENGQARLLKKDKEAFEKEQTQS